MSWSFMRKNNPAHIFQRIYAENGDPSFFFTFFPMNLLGILGMPRRVAVYAPEYQPLNQLVSFAAFVLGISTFIFIGNAIYSLYRGPRAGANPWRALR